MINQKTPVVFENLNNFNLAGILHKATADSSRDIAVLLISPGFKGRVAPHRLYVKMANRFNDLGFDVLRFDPEGIGDSEGEIIEDQAADVLSSIEIGRYITDTISAMDWMEKEHGAKSFILSGLCGGAITGLLTAAEDTRVDSVLGLGIPVVLSSLKRQDPYAYISQGELRGMRKRYIMNAINLKKWWRFLTLRSDYRMIFKSIFMSAKPSENQASSYGRKKPDLTKSSNLNPLFVKSIFSVLHSSRDICLIFSERDRLYYEFEEKFIARYQQDFQKFHNRCEISVVKDANHIFSSPQWVESMLSTACEWLIRKYP